MTDDNDLSFTTPTLMDSGETVMRLALHLALCRALYDLLNQVPFAIRGMDGLSPLVAYDGDALSGTHPELVTLLNGCAEQARTELGAVQ